MKKHWKKLIAVIMITVLLVIVLRTAFGRYVFLEGANFWLDYCSVDITSICYWYNDEVGEFVGDTAEIRLRVTGFEVKQGNFEDSLKGGMHISGYEMKDEHGKFISYRSDYFEEFRVIKCMEYYVESWNEMSSPVTGYTYFVVFSKEHPEYVRVLVQDSEKVIIRMGYMADCQEEAERAKDFYESKNWWTENGV